ncbi:MAG: DUF1501 domain-containing protein, partial [Planctomycetota bacterium]
MSDTTNNAERSMIPQLRRRFLGNVLTGMSGLGLLDLLGGNASGAEFNRDETNKTGTHHPAAAKRVLQIFCPGAASHLDLWEHKPMLEKMHGKPMPGEENLVSFQGKNGNLMKSPDRAYLFCCASHGKTR